MTTRVVEGKKPYTGGTAITVDENKVISLNLRDENNLIIYDEGDDEIYVDLQLPDEISPTDAFPVGVTTGRVLIDNDWDVTGTILVAKTTSGDVIKLLYGDDQTLWIDNGTGLFKQLYFKSDVDQIITTLTTYINTELAKKQNGVTSATAPTNPSQGDLRYDTVNDVLKVYDGSQWNTTGGGGSGDVQVSTDAGNLLTTGVKLWLGNKEDFDNLGSLDSNTIYAPIKGLPRQPGANTIAYFPFSSDSLDATENNTLTNSGTQNGLGWEFSSGSDITTPSGTINYVSFWIQINDYGSTNNGICLYNKRGMGYYSYSQDPASNKKIFVWYDSSFSTASVSFEPSTGTRHHISYGYDGTKTIYSIDGVSGTLYNGIGYDFGDSFMVTQKGGVVISKLILEDTCWTAEQIQEYYNSTKSDYGL